MRALRALARRRGWRYAARRFTRLDAGLSGTPQQTTQQPRMSRRHARVRLTVVAVAAHCHGVRIAEIAQDEAAAALARAGVPVHRVEPTELVTTSGERVVPVD